MKWTYTLKNGQEQIEFDESQLTPMQKRALRTGDGTLESMRPTSRIYGERISELRLYAPTLRDEFRDGPIDFGDTNEVEDLIYKPSVQLDVSAFDEATIQLGSGTDDLFG
jgi:hypothetical protein